MALRRAIFKRLSNPTTRDSPSLNTVLVQPPPPPRPMAAPPPNIPHSGAGGFFRRFLQSSPAGALPTFMSLPVGEKLREKLKMINGAGAGEDQRLRLDGLRVEVEDVKRVMRFVEMERVRERLRNVPTSTMRYGEFVQMCGDGDTGLKYAKAMEECGSVVVLGGVVFLRPDQVAKSMEKLISQTIALPNDPRRKELDTLENQKAFIDQKARSGVQGELYCGLGFMCLQTLGFMRLTFWELSWDVMEPICFFVTSLHFALAYAFFLRTSKEPSFEGYFQRRFKVKQKKLMKVHNFDIERYNQLCEVFYPYYGQEQYYRDGAGSRAFGSVHG